MADPPQQNPDAPGLRVPYRRYLRVAPPITPGRSRPPFLGLFRHRSGSTFAPQPGPFTDAPTVDKPTDSPTADKPTEPEDINTTHNPPFHSVPADSHVPVPVSAGGHAQYVEAPSNESSQLPGATINKEKTLYKKACDCMDRPGRNLVVCIDGTSNKFGDTVRQYRSCIHQTWSLPGSSANFP
jgi:hypothetical protein